MALHSGCEREKEAHRAAMPTPPPSGAHSKKPLYYVSSFTKYKGFCDWAGIAAARALMLKMLRPVRLPEIQV